MENREIVLVCVCVRKREGGRERNERESGRVKEQLKSRTPESADDLASRDTDIMFTSHSQPFTCIF